MTPRTTAVITACALVLLASSQTALCEVAVIRETNGAFAGTLVMFEIDSTVGGPTQVWSRVRPTADLALVLNPDGDLYRDGPPSIALNPVTRLPEAVWSYWDGAHYQIAWSRFDGQAWSMVQTAGGPDFEFLTADARQNLDPKLWIDAAGNRRVTWWRRSYEGADDVVVATLPAGEVQWWTPQRVSIEGLPTRRPDIRTYPMYGTFIAAEEDDAGLLTPVVFDSPQLNGHDPQRGSDPWGRTIVRSTSAGSSLRVSLSGIPSPGGATPVLTWRLESSHVKSLFDGESLTWSIPLYTTQTIWW